MANPYSGLKLRQLQSIQAFLIGTLSGATFQSTSVQGSGFVRKIASLEEARLELGLVNQAINALDPTASPTITRTVIRAV
jgi:hypothetical protein